MVRFGAFVKPERQVAGELQKPFGIGQQPVVALVGSGQLRNQHDYGGDAGSGETHGVAGDRVDAAHGRHHSADDRETSGGDFDREAVEAENLIDRQTVEFSGQAGDEEPVHPGGGILFEQGAVPGHVQLPGGSERGQRGRPDSGRKQRGIRFHHRLTFRNRADLPHPVPC